MNKKLLKLSILLTLAVSLISCVTVQSAPAASCPETQAARTVTVSGTGSVTIEPDMAKFAISVTEEKPTTSEALNSMNLKITRILGILKELGVRDDDISTDTLNLYPVFDWVDSSRVLRAQCASQSINVKIHQLDSLSRIIDKVVSVDGISLNDIRFDRVNKDEFNRLARRIAMDDALSKAKDYASFAGLEVGKPVKIEQRSDYSYRVYNAKNTASPEAAMDLAAAAGTSVPTGDLDVSVTVNCVYELI